MTKDVANTLAERGARYGAFIEHARICQGLLEVVRNVPSWHKLDPDMRQALSTIFDKIARILNGDPYYDDNWHDIQGYAKLVEDRIKGMQTLFEAEPTDELTQEEKGKDRDYIQSVKEDLIKNLELFVETETDHMNKPPTSENTPCCGENRSSGPPNGWRPSYSGDESWRGKGYNPPDGYDG